MNEMFERIAEAIEQYDLDSASGVYRQNITLAVIAVIKAMREPTKEMLEAIENEPMQGPGGITCDVARWVWQYLIDEVLK